MTRASIALLAFAIVGNVLGCRSADELVKLTAIGRSHELREERDDGRAASRRPGLLLIGIDGMKRDVLYGLLHEGALPGLASILGGGAHGTLPHAYLSSALMAGLPSMA